MPGLLTPCGIVAQHLRPTLVCPCSPPGRGRRNGQERSLSFLMPVDILAAHQLHDLDGFSTGTMNLASHISQRKTAGDLDTLQYARSLQDTVGSISPAWVTLHHPIDLLYLTKGLCKKQTLSSPLERRRSTARLCGATDA